MGFWWDAFQQYQISKESSRSGTLEERVASLEGDLDTAYDVIEQMAGRIEQLEGLVLPPEPPEAGDQTQLQEPPSV